MENCSRCSVLHWPLGGGHLFELVGVKGDLGALFLGALLAGTQKSKELSRRLIQFKDLFLVCFFLSIGLSGWPTEEMLLVAISWASWSSSSQSVYFPLMTRLHTPPRTALLCASVMGNYSEFGLVVIVLAAKSGWIDTQWAKCYFCRNCSQFHIFVLT